MKWFVTAEEAMIKERGARNGIAAGFGDTLRDRARGMADFEPEIKERVEDSFDDLLEFLAEFVGRLGEQEEEIEIGARIEETPAVAPIGDQRDGNRGLVSKERSFEQRTQEVVDGCAAEGCNFVSSRAGFMNFAHPFVLGLQMPLVDRETLGGREFSEVGGIEFLGDGNGGGIRGGHGLSVKLVGRD
jgi:hypothetical protein